MSFVRPACYKKFADIIDSVYKRAERDDTVGEKRKLVGVELEDYLFNIISSVLDAHHVAGLNHTVDLFAFGVDSLHASRIQNHIQQDIDLGEHKLSSTGESTCSPPTHKCLTLFQLSTTIPRSRSSLLILSNCREAAQSPRRWITRRCWATSKSGWRKLNLVAFLVDRQNLSMLVSWFVHYFPSAYHEY